ncbi:MAG: hypothetical protein JW829_03410 [Pirellulales bacterium]|nr:hypothetical protein [Pirellulales bacterium]
MRLFQQIQPKEWIRVDLWIITITLGLAAMAVSTAQGIPDAKSLPEPIYWKQYIFSIPYRVHRDAMAPDAPVEVRLFVSSDRGISWKEVSRVPANIKGFTYYATADGEYWFALQTTDRRGTRWPPGPHQVGLRVIVDTESPRIQLSATMAPSGAVDVRWQVADENILPSSLKIDAKTGIDGAWQAISPAPWTIAAEKSKQLEGFPAVSDTAGENIGPCGHMEWQPPDDATNVLLRAIISDQAGNHSESSASVSLADRPERVAMLPRPQEPAQDGQGVFSSPMRVETVSQPLYDPIKNGQEIQDEDAQVLGTDEGNPPFQGSPNLNPDPPDWQTLPTTGRPIETIPSDPIGEILAANPPAPGHETPVPLPPIQPERPSLRMVNARSFALEYEVESVGPWGVGRVELWGTTDGGKTWQRFADDPDLQSPMTVTVQGEGEYGFRILIHSAGSIHAAPPREGDTPDVWIQVDLKPPTVMIEAIRKGQGNLADHLTIRWTADDERLAERPIALFYASHPAGPWTTIATQLDNTGQYMWRLPQHVPEQLFIRVEARDRAGNSGIYSTAEPIRIQRPQPTGHIRGVRTPD